MLRGTVQLHQSIMMLVQSILETLTMYTLPQIIVVAIP